MVTSVVSSEEVITRINDFLCNYRSELIKMTNDDYMNHLVGLAKNKLEMFDSLEEECDSYWSEISEGRYNFETNREEVQCLRSITKELMMNAYDKWLSPICEKGKPKKRRGMSFRVIGTGDAVSQGRPLTDSNANLRTQVDDLIEQFHSKNKDSWGRIVFAAPLKRANTN